VGQACSWRSESACRTLRPMQLGARHPAGLLAPLAAGAAVILPAGGRFSATTFWRDAVDFGATFYTAVPTMHQARFARPAGLAPRCPARRAALCQRDAAQTCAAGSVGVKSEHALQSLCASAPHQATGGLQRVGDARRSCCRAPTRTTRRPRRRRCASSAPARHRWRPPRCTSWRPPSRCRCWRCAAPCLAGARPARRAKPARLLTSRPPVADLRSSCELASC